MKLFDKTILCIKRVIELIVTFAFAMLLLDVLWGIFSRYLLGNQSRWTEEVAIYLLVWVTFLAMPLAYHTKSHLGVDFLIRKLHPSISHWSGVIVHFCTGILAVMVLLLGGWQLVYETLKAQQMSPALGIPVGVFYSVVPLSGFILFTFCIHGGMRGEILSLEAENKAN